jgi:hypothetical protein
MLFRIFNRITGSVLTVLLSAPVFAHSGHGEVSLVHHHLDAWSMLFVVSAAVLAIALAGKLYRK